jgi:hypothetical protein
MQDNVRTPIIIAALQDIEVAIKRMEEFAELNGQVVR